MPRPEAARSKTWTGSCHGTSARSKGGRGDVKMRSRRRTHHSHVAWSGSDEEFQSQTPQPAWDAAWDRVRAERKQAGLPNTYRAIGFVLALFYHRHLPPSAFTGHYPHAPRSTPHAGTSEARPCADPPAGSCMQPTGELVRTERDPISTSTPLFHYVTETGDSCRQNQSVSSHSPPPNRWPFSRGRRRSKPSAPGVPAGSPKAAMPIHSLMKADS